MVVASQTDSQAFGRGDAPAEGVPPHGGDHTSLPELTVLARTEGGDVFARRVLPPVEAVAVASRWVELCPGLTVEVIRWDKERGNV